MADIFEAIADSSRRQLLQFLAVEHQAAGSGELSVSDLVSKSMLGQPTVSKHLKVLRECDLVAVRQVGQKSMYRITPAALLAVQQWLDGLLPDSEGNSIPGWLNSRLAIAGEWVSSKVQIETDPRELGLALGRRLADARFEAATGTKDFAALAKSRIDEFVADLRRRDSDEDIPR